MKGRLGRQKNLKLYFRHGPQPSGGDGATCGTGQSAEAAELDALQGDFISRQPCVWKDVGNSCGSAFPLTHSWPRGFDAG